MILAGFFVGLLYFLVVLVSLILAGVILIQDSKAGGLSTAFGGAGGEALLGAGSASQITKFTAVVSVIFFGLCLLVGVLNKVESESSTVSDEPPQVGAAGGGEGSGGTGPREASGTPVSPIPPAGGGATPGAIGAPPTGTSPPGSENGEPPAGTPPPAPPPGVPPPGASGEQESPPPAPNPDGGAPEEGGG